MQGQRRAPAAARSARLTARAARADRMIKGRQAGDAWDEMALLAAWTCAARPMPVPLPRSRVQIVPPCNPSVFSAARSIPIHYGHLRTAFELWQALKLDGGALHAGRQPAAPACAARECRAAACAWCARRSRSRRAFVVDDREVRRTGVSYSVDTLTELRAEFPDRSLCLLLGMDAFLGLPNWHRWRELFDLAHVVVAHRPGWKAPTQGPLGEVMVDRGTGSVRDLHEQRAGRIYVHAVTQLEISSTELRQVIVRAAIRAISCRTKSARSSARRDAMLPGVDRYARQSSRRHTPDT